METGAEEAEWSRALNKQKGRLSRKKYAGILQHLDYHAFMASLRGGDGPLAERNNSKYLSILTPALDFINPFIASITSCVQAGNSITGFVWGAIQAVIVAASKFQFIMETVTEMFRELTDTMAKCLHYTILFPTDESLRASLRVLIGDYVGFCITTFKFLRRCRIYNYLRMFWSTVDQKFKKARDNINKHYSELMTLGKLAVDRELVERNRRIEGLLQRPTFMLLQPENLYLVPYARNPHFYGRNHTLSLLHEQLSAPLRPAPRLRSSTIHGIGGVGKTQVAIEYTYLYRKYYDYIFWIHAGTDAELSDDVAIFAKKLHPFEVGDTTNRAAVEMVKMWLETTDKQWLLVFDNAEDWASVDPYWPCSPHGSILITSQNAQLTRATHSEISLKPFEQSEGAGFLLSQIHNNESSPTRSENAKLISDELGGLPLAIAHVAGYISETGVSTRDFLSLLKQRSNTALIFDSDVPINNPLYKKTLGVVWDIALQKLSPDALKLIQILSMMNPDGVPVDMLYAPHNEPALLFLRTPNLIGFNDIIRSLRRRQLVGREEETGGGWRLLIHRSLQRSILHRLDTDPERFQATFNMSLTLVRKVFPRQSSVQFPQNDIWEKCEKYSSHVMSLRATYAESASPPAPSIEFAEMLSDVSNYFWERNIFGDGLQASDTAESICEKLQGQFKNQRANVYTVAASLRNSHGISDRAGALHRFQKALSLRQEYLGELDPSEVTNDDIVNYANAWSNVGYALLDHEHYEHSLHYSELAITIRMKLGGDYEVSSYETTKNKCIALAALGRYEEAIDLIPRDTNLPELKPYFVALQLFHFLWANVLLAAGKLEAAHEKLLEVLAYRTNTFGPSGRSTLDTYYMLAMADYKCGKLKQAEIYLRKALEMADEWTDEARARAQHHLGQILCLLNRQDEARVFQHSAQKTRDKLSEAYTTYLPPGTILDEDLIYDHIAPMEAGRPTLGALRLPGVKTPRLNRICHLLNDRLLATGDKVLSPAELSSLLQPKGNPIPIEEDFAIN